MLCRCDAVGKHGDDGVAVCGHPGRQPESDRREISEAPDGLFRKRPAAESRKEGRKMGEILPRFSIKPTLEEASAENAKTRVSRAFPLFPLRTREASGERLHDYPSSSHVASDGCGSQTGVSGMRQ